MRMKYWGMFVIRCIVLVLSVLLYIYKKDAFDILEGANFFKEFSVLHILWIAWVIDMLFQLIPSKLIPLGSQKLFKQRFKSLTDKINYQALRDYISKSTKYAYRVFIIWSVMTIALGILYHFEILTAAHLFLICVLFYVGDLVCVLIWCPFRLIVKTRCCTTCRIYNWDHLMMFTPMLFVSGFYSISLVILAFAVWVLWELYVMMYPERFWEKSNGALQCSQCTDKLCTQFCRKPRK